MAKIDKKTVYAALQKCEKLEEANVASSGKVEEAETRSLNNELLALALGDFGVHVAEVIAMAQAQKDYVEQLYEETKLRFMRDADPDNVNAKGEIQKHTATKAESLAKSDIKYIGELSTLRDLQKAENVLKRKEKSLFSALDQSRSRLSLVNKDRA